MIKIFIFHMYETEWLSIMQDQGYMTSMIDIGNVPGVYPHQNNSGPYNNKILKQSNPAATNLVNPPPTPGM